MTQEQELKKKKADEKEPVIKPDPETLHKTDPQDNMKGPISSLVQGVKEVVEENDKESKEEATKKRGTPVGVGECVVGDILEGFIEDDSLLEVEIK